MRARSGTATASLRRLAARQCDNNKAVRSTVIATIGANAHGIAGIPAGTDIIVVPGSRANPGSIG
jgi:hypothetical protein